MWPYLFHRGSIQEQVGERRNFSRYNKKNKRTISFSNIDSSSSKSEPERKVPRLSSDASSHAHRLKPPPDLINFDKKVIKLSDSSESKSNSSLDKVVIKSKSKESPSESKSSKSANETNGKQDLSSRPKKLSPAAIKLKRDSTSSKAGSKQEETKVEDTSKKKRQKIVISWR